MGAIPGLTILASGCTERLGVISFNIEDLHYNLASTLLNDRFGIQMRGGCACAGTYGHYLLEISRRKSKEIAQRVDEGDWSTKVGFVRLSIHPIMADDEIRFITTTLKELAAHFREWQKDYSYNAKTNEFSNRKRKDLGRRPDDSLRTS